MTSAYACLPKGAAYRPRLAIRPGTVRRPAERAPGSGDGPDHPVHTRPGGWGRTAPAWRQHSPDARWGIVGEIIGPWSGAVAVMALQNATYATFARTGVVPVGSQPFRPVGIGSQPFRFVPVGAVLCRLLASGPAGAGARSGPWAGRRRRASRIRVRRPPRPACQVCPRRRCLGGFARVVTSRLRRSPGTRPARCRS